MCQSTCVVLPDRNFWCTETKFAYLHNIYIHQNICNPLYSNGLMLWVRYFMWITSILQDLEHLLLTNHIEAFTTTMIIENNWYPLFRCNVPHSCFQLCMRFWGNFMCPMSNLSSTNVLHSYLKRSYMFVDLKPVLLVHIC